MGIGNTKPWGIARRGDEYVVRRRNQETGKLFGPSLGTHPSHASAQEQIDALHANVHEKAIPYTERYHRLVLIMRRLMRADELLRGTILAMYKPPTILRQVAGNLRVAISALSGEVNGREGGLTDQTALWNVRQSVKWLQTYIALSMKVRAQFGNTTRTAENRRRIATVFAALYAIQKDLEALSTKAAARKATREQLVNKLYPAVLRADNITHVMRQQIDRLSSGPESDNIPDQASDHAANAVDAVLRAALKIKNTNWSTANPTSLEIIETLLIAALGHVNRITLPQQYRGITDSARSALRLAIDMSKNIRSAFSSSMLPISVEASVLLMASRRNGFVTDQNERTVFMAANRYANRDGENNITQRNMAEALQRYAPRRIKSTKADRAELADYLWTMVRNAVEAATETRDKLEKLLSITTDPKDKAALQRVAPIAANVVLTLMGTTWVVKRLQDRNLDPKRQVPGIISDIRRKLADSLTATSAYVARYNNDAAQATQVARKIMLCLKALGVLERSPNLMKSTTKQTGERARLTGNLANMLRKADVFLRTATDIYRKLSDDPNDLYHESLMQTRLKLARANNALAGAQAALMLYSGAPEQLKKMNHDIVAAHYAVKDVQDWTNNRYHNRDGLAQAEGALRNARMELFRAMTGGMIRLIQYERSDLGTQQRFPGVLSHRFMTEGELRAAARLPRIKSQEKTMQSKSTQAVYLPLSIVKSLCPECATLMEKKGIKALRADNLPPGFVKAVKQKLGGDPGFFTRCMSHDFGRTFSDKEGFCAFLHKKVLGTYPAESRSATRVGKATSRKEIDPSRLPQQTLERMVPRLLAGLRSMKNSLDKISASWNALKPVAEDYPEVQAAVGSLNRLWWQTNKYYEALNQDYQAMAAALRGGGIRGASTKVDVLGLLRIRVDSIPSINAKKKALAEVQSSIAALQPVVNQGKAVLTAVDNATDYIAGARDYILDAVRVDQIGRTVGASLPQLFGATERRVSGLRQVVTRSLDEKKKVLAGLQQKAGELRKAIERAGG